MIRSIDAVPSAPQVLRMWKQILCGTGSIVFLLLSPLFPAHPFIPWGFALACFLAAIFFAWHRRQQLAPIIVLIEQGRRLQRSGPQGVQFASDAYMVRHQWKEEVRQLAAQYKIELRTPALAELVGSKPGMPADEIESSIEVLKGIQDSI